MTALRIVLSILMLIGLTCLVDATAPVHKERQRPPGSAIAWAIMLAGVIVSLTLAEAL